jgi:hypothetical protein
MTSPAAFSLAKLHVVSKAKSSGVLKSDVTMTNLVPDGAELIFFSPLTDEVFLVAETSSMSATSCWEKRVSTKVSMSPLLEIWRVIWVTPVDPDPHPRQDWNLEVLAQVPD